MPAVVDRSVDSLAGLVGTVVEISSQVPADQPLWFRGHNKSSYRLLPTLLRDGKNQEAVFEREKRLLIRFRQRSIAYWPAGYPQNDWEQLFAMQHYGVPTRLLDWTENLFVAAYFALAGISSKSSGDDAEKPVVWCINPVAWNRAMPALSEFGDSIRILTTADEEAEAYRPETIKKRPKSPVAVFGTHNSQRIVAQRGTFTIWGSDLRPMEEIASSSIHTLLWRIVFSGGVSHLFPELQRLGFGETMVFPELSYLAEELKRIEGWR